MPYPFIPSYCAKIIIIYRSLHFFFPVAFISLNTTTSFVARLYSHPPKISICGPIDVAVCPYLLSGGCPSNLPFSQISSLSVFSTMK